MSPEKSTAVEHLKSVIQRTSTVTLAGGLFSIPAVFLVSFTVPNAVGFTIIATTGLITHTILRSLDPNTTPEIDTDLSSLDTIQIYLFISLIFTSAITGITIKLLVATGLAILFSGITGSIIAIFVAVIFPVFDRKLSSIKWFLSVSALSAVFIVYIAAFLLKPLDIVNDISSSSIKRKSLQFSM